MSAFWTHQELLLRARVGGGAAAAAAADDATVNSFSNVFCLWPVVLNKLLTTIVVHALQPSWVQEGARRTARHVEVTAPCAEHY